MSIWSLLVKVLLFAVGAAAVVVLFVMGVSDGNDYLYVTVDKHTRLETSRTPRLVFIGGSNLAYGLDSEAVEGATGRDTVNMGLNAHVGLAFMFHEVLDTLNRGDTVVAALEYFLYYDGRQYASYHDDPPFEGVQGEGGDLLFLVKARPASLRALSTWPQRTAVAAAVPYAAQQKALRLIDTGVSGLFGAPAATIPGAPPAVERRAGFNKWGDLVSHRDVPAPFRPARQAGVPAALQPSPRSIEFLREMRDRLHAKGVELVLLPPPVNGDFYAEERANLDLIVQETRRVLPNEAAMLRPERYVFPDACFFDEVFHLTYECRSTRTNLIIEDLRTVFQP